METKSNHKELIHLYEEGKVPASQVYVKLRTLKQDIDKALKMLEDGVMDELVKMNNYEDLVVWVGNEGYKKIVEVSGRTTYDYKQNNMWLDADNERKRIERLIKLATNDGVHVIDQETGEVVEPVNKKVGKSYLKLETPR